MGPAGPDGRLAWVVAPAGAAGHTVTIYRVVHGAAQELVSATDPTGLNWSHVTVRPATFTGLERDGVPIQTLVVGFRMAGSGGQLAVDVVSNETGTVAFHRDVDHGVVVLGDGQYQEWAARFGPTDPNCCPSAYERSVVRFVGDAWRVVIAQTVPPSAVPEGQFP